MLLHLLELELSLVALGDVAGDFRETHQPAVFVDRIDDDARPEERAILADAPAVFLVAALFPGNSERARRLAVGAVGFGVEAGKMFAQDFLGGIALDALAPDIPARDDATGVEHIERIVRNTLDQEAETTLAFEQIPLLPMFFQNH